MNVAVSDQIGRLGVAMNAAMNDLDGGMGRDLAHANTCAATMPANRSYGPACAPADLLDFVRGTPVAQAVRELALAQGTVHRLRCGYWPADPRKILRAWERYKARRSVVASSWFVRRVYPGGVVRHAGRAYTALALAPRVGQILAVTRTADGPLLAQTLELPAERVALQPLELPA